MKFLHTADLHIGKSRKLPGYLERQDQMLSEIFRIGSQHTDGLVIIAGDVYDRLDLLPQEKDLMIKHLCRADRTGLTTVVIGGNHDMIEEDDGLTHLRTLRLMVEERRLRRTYVIETVPSTFVLEPFDLTLICVPSYYRKTKEVNKIVHDHLKANTSNSTQHTVAVVHETVLGARNDKGKRMGVDFGSADHCVELDHSLAVDYWALGDIHCPQRIQGCPNAWYSGAPMQHEFGEDDARGVLIVDAAKPTDPELIELKGIKKLATVHVTADTKPEDIPTDAHVRIAGDRQHIRRLKTVEAVVGTKIDFDEPVDVIEDVKVSDVLLGLPEILLSMNLSEEDQRWMLEEAERIR